MFLKLRIHLEWTRWKVSMTFTENEMLLLGDVFEKIRHSSFKCYFSEPDLSWDTISYMAKFKVERISDADMYLFFEKDMINRVLFISKR